MRSTNVALLFALLAITYLIGTTLYVDRIEQDILNRANTAAAPYRPSVNVSVEGRDITLSGSVNSLWQKAAIGNHIADVAGARATQNLLQLEPTQFRFSAEFRGSELTLTGALDSDESIDALKRIRAQLDPSIRVHQLVNAGAPAIHNTREKLDTGIESLTQLIEGSLQIDDRHWRLQGLAADPTTRARIEALVEARRESLKPLTVTMDLDIHSLISEACKRYLHQDTSGTQVKFSSGSIEVKPEYMARLRQYAALPGKCSGRLLIEAHSDNEGDEQYNLMLSKQRAAAIKQYLIKLGADPRTIHSFAYGEMRAAASNESRNGKSANRRVDLHFIQSLTAIPLKNNSSINISQNSAE
jgi:outer membrane protein OmpA-like peptidoglycan-associated protein